MISANEVREHQEKINKEKRELYLSKFDEYYKVAKDRLETSIKTVLENNIRKTYIMLHDMEIASKLEKECIELGYKVHFSMKERQFYVEW